MRSQKHMFKPSRTEGPGDKPTKPPPIRVYDPPAHEMAYWDALDVRVTCDDCTEKRGFGSCTVKATGSYPAEFRHHCDGFTPLARARMKIGPSGPDGAIGTS